MVMLPLLKQVLGLNKSTLIEKTLEKLTKMMIHTSKIREVDQITTILIQREAIVITLVTRQLTEVDKQFMMEEKRQLMTQYFTTIAQNIDE